MFNRQPLDENLLYPLGMHPMAAFGISADSEISQLNPSHARLGIRQAAIGTDN